VGKAAGEHVATARNHAQHQANEALAELEKKEGRLAAARAPSVTSGVGALPPDLGHGVCWITRLPEG
jgi:hypothetical protein